MMEWNENRGYSICGKYHVVLMRDQTWSVYFPGKDAAGFPYTPVVQTDFTTREEAKQWCEMHNAVGA